MRAAFLTASLVAAVALAAEPAPAQQQQPQAPPQVLLPRLDLKLPPGWKATANPGGPLTWLPKGGDAVGALQVSRVNDKDVGFVAQQKELGAYAAEVGTRLGWGKAQQSSDVPCEMGRAGMAVFPTQADAHLKRLWIVVSGTSAYMWTWISTVPNKDLDEQALQMVMEAKEAKNAVPAAALKAIDALDKTSPARVEAGKAKSAESVHLAMLVDKDGKPMAVERPVLSGRFTILPPPKEKALALNVHFDAEVAQIFSLVVTFGPTVKLSLSRNPRAPYSQPARLRAAGLWNLVGERIDVPYEPLELEATLLGAKLNKTRVPSGFAAPGHGEWLLLKTSKPGELYVALNLELGIVEFFPIVPLQADAAAKALFRAL